MTDSKELWIKTGYESFALLGENSLKIEVLAKKVGISKSSFYHHFSFLEIFIDSLLEYHLQQSFILAEKERNAQTIEPDLINILIEHKIDLLFNRQLRINQQNKTYHHTLIKSNQIVGKDFITIWAKELKLQLTQRQLEGIFELALENFFLQINPENFNQLWLSAYFQNLKKIIKSLEI
jgi:AcrR family transcriptional regulator